MYGEIVVFDNGVKGMVQDIRENEIGVILFGRDTGIKEGTKVVRTKKKAGIPVGCAFVGRVINALIAPTGVTSQLIFFQADKNVLQNFCRIPCDVLL